MKYSICIPSFHGCRYYFDLLSYSDFQCISVPSVCVINICKVHNHRYDLEAFFYYTKRIYSLHSFRSKSELYGAIQNLLQQNLNIDVQ